MMLQKHTIFILITLIFPMIISFAQEEISVLEQKNAGIIQMKEAVSKLSDKMTIDEAKELLGEPTFKTNLTYVYFFVGGERIELNLKGIGGLSVRNKDGFDLLSTIYWAEDLGYPISIDGNKLSASYPIVSINGNIYLSIKDRSDLFGVGVNFDKEKLRSEAITKDKMFGWYTSDVVDFPVFIDSKELITSNPIVAINGNMYLPIEELVSELGIKIIFDKDKRLYEITTNIQPSTNIFDKYYPALVTDNSIYIDDNKLLTFNPIVTINGNIYLPIDELEEELQVKVDHDKDKPTLEITTGMGEGFVKSKDIASISRFKKDISKIHKDMTQKEVEQIVSSFYNANAPNLEKDNNISLIESDLFTRNSIPPLRYRHQDGGILTPAYGGAVLPSYGKSLFLHVDSLSALFNEDGLDLLATGYVAKLVDFPVFIDGKELLTISNPIVTIHNKVYVPLDDIAEQLGIKVTFNEEKQQLKITTK